MQWVFVLALCGFATALQASVPPDPIDDFVASEVPAKGAPGLAYAVLQDGEISSGARGETLAGSGKAITPDTRFVLGSISKSFTAVAVMQLVEAGEVDLDAGISQYLETFSDSPGGSITIRQLLGQTSGYSTLQGNDTLAAPGPGADGLQRQVERIAGWTPAYPPGTRWDYSNANYYVLGALIEGVSGQDYARYVEAEILAPIGMADSFVADGEIHDEIARGHTPWFGGKRAVPEGATDRMSAPVGGVIATARDTARYLAVMMNGEDDIISAGSKSEMMRPAADEAPFYGFGWYIDRENGTVSHTGLTPGVETLAIMVPAERKGLVILLNSGSGMGFGENAALFNGLSARALGLDEASEGGRWSRQALFASFALLPLVFAAGILVAWLRRDGLRAKAGLSGTFSLWFPLLMTLVLAWTTLILVPQLFGVSIGTLGRFSPDLALVMIATAVTGLLWAVFRLGAFHSGKSGPT
ncbi:serine hydrolase domain-containing protein [Henriciella sp.]|uniref:serine hydrolase domain-containing protein n=1 Tax=Henriciella sp. TaxID=1968823 RepID=UPI0026186B80|nr:serine hydrolase domain-containing protein [Henriciella sp.]